MIIKYRFHSHFNLKTLMHKLADMKLITLAKELVQDREDLKDDLIHYLSNIMQIKKAAKCIKDFNYNIEDYQKIKMKIIRNSMRY